MKCDDCFKILRLLTKVKQSLKCLLCYTFKLNCDDFFKILRSLAKSKAVTITFSNAVVDILLKLDVTIFLNFIGFKWKVKQSIHCT